MKKVVLIIMLFAWVTGNLFAQGIVNKGAGIWIGANTALKVNGGYTNKQTGTFVGTIFNNGTFSVSLNWINDTTTELIFQEGSKGAVVLTGGDQTVIGSTRFYDFTKSAATSAVLTFQAGSKTTVTNSLTLNGAEGQRLQLRSSIDGTQWYISPPETRVLQYFDLKDSNNNSGTKILLDDTCTDFTGNTNWFFATYKVRFDVEGPGTLEGETNQIVRYNSVSSPVKAVGNYGWKFAKWVDQDRNEYSDNPMVFGPVSQDSILIAFFTEDTYTLSMTSTAGGSCDPTGDITVGIGESRTIQIIPDGGYFTKNVVVDGQSVGEISSYSFTNIIKNHTLNAVFEENPVINWNITSSKSGNGTISPLGEVVVEDGSSATFSISPDDGYIISDVLVDNISQGVIDTYTFSNIKENHTILAEFKEIPPQTYILTSSAGNGGEITPLGNIQVQEGNSKTFSIQANSGNAIAQVLIDNIPVGALSSFTFNKVLANHTIHAEFNSDPVSNYTVTATSGDGGRISPPGAVLVEDGKDVTFSIYPEEGWEITDLIVDQKSVAPVSTYKFSKVTGNHSIHATFSPVTYTITSTLTEGGRVIPSGVITVNSGETKTFTSIPDGGYYLKTVVVDSKPVGAVPSYIFPNISANHSIHAIFEKSQVEDFQILASTSEGGSLSPTGTVNVSKGNDVTFTVSPNQGYMIEDINVDGSSLGGLESYSFRNVTSNHVIYAEFKEIPPGKYIITSKAETGGSITPLGQMLLDEGDSLNFSISPEDFFLIEDVLVDGTSVGSVTSYSFEDISSNHKIEARFKPSTFLIVANAGDNGTVTPSGETSVDIGSSLLFVFTPDSGYHVENVIIDGISRGKIVEYEFVDIRSDHVLEVTFAPGEEVYHVIHSTALKGGTISPLGRISVKDGENADFVILPKYGFKIEDVLVDEVSVGKVENYSFTNVTDNHSLSAVFTKDESGIEGIVLGISVNNAKGGWVTPKPGKYSVTENSTVKLEVVPSEAFVFEGWSIVGGELEDSRSQIIELDITGPTEITANFAPIVSQIQLIMRQSPIASGSISPEGTVFVQSGEAQQLRAVPATGYEFNQWVLTSGVAEIEDPNSSQTTLTASSNAEVTAVFSRNDITANVTIDVNGAGFVDPQGEITVPVGSVLDVTAIAATGYNFVDWDITEGGIVVSPCSLDTKVIVTGNCQLNATFIVSDQIASLSLSEDDTGVLKVENLEKGATRKIQAFIPIYKVFDFWNCLEDDTAVINPFSPVTTVEVNQNLTVGARFAKNFLTDYSIKKIILDVSANTMEQASGDMKLSFFPCSPGSFDPANDRLEFCFNGISYVFPEDSIRQIGKKNAWIASLKGDSGIMRLQLEPEKGEFHFKGKKLLLNNTILNGEVNYSLQVGSRYDFYRFSPWKDLYLKFKKQPDEVLEKLPVTGLELDEFSVNSVTVHVDVKKPEKNFLRIRKMTFALPEGVGFDPETDTVSVQIGDLSINLAPGTLKSKRTKEAYVYIDKENRINLLLNVNKGKGHLTIGKLKNLPAGCDDGQLDIYLRLGDYGGGVKLFFKSVRKRLYWKGGEK